jgi:hypothetical protein
VIVAVLPALSTALTVKSFGPSGCVSKPSSVQEEIPEATGGGPPASGSVQLYSGVMLSCRKKCSLLAGFVKEISGGVVSSIHEEEAGVASTLPALSTART